jgi:hypothetical protein
MLKHAWVTLHLPPPLIFTLLRSLEDFSNSNTFIEGSFAAAFTAQKKPAAPPPITTSVLGAAMVFNDYFMNDCSVAARYQNKKIICCHFAL